MKKIILVILSYLLVAFLICLGIGYAVGNVPDVLPGQRSTYMLFRALLYFLRLLPALLTSGFLVTTAIYFGHHAESARERFSPAIIAHFKMILLVSLGMVCVLALTREVFEPRVAARQKLAAEAPELLNEYLISGRYCIVIKSYVLAHEYAKQALKLAPGNKDAQALLDDAERNMNQMRARAKREEQESALRTEWREVANETVTSLIQKANRAKQEGLWFDAHYYAQLALKLGDGSDINIKEARMLASEAWNELETSASLVDAGAKSFYDRKKRAYAYLMSGDNLEAYYAFMELQNNTNAATVDPDVKNFFEIAKERLVSEAFFIDETLHLQLFESVQDIYFTITHSDGVRDVIFIKGITAVSNSGRMIQYLREFSQYTYAADGTFLRSVKTPYAKMIAEPVNMLDTGTLSAHGITESFKQVPYVILLSVSRDLGHMKNEPVYEFAPDIPEEERVQPTALFLPLPFDDFNLVCDASVGSQHMYLLALMKMVGKADSFGYAGEVYSAALISRLTYPLLMLIVLILTAGFAWNYRVEENQLFKFTWSFILPVCTVILYPLLEMLLYVEDLMCYALSALLGSSAVAVAIVIYAALLILSATYFMARKA